MKSMIFFALLSVCIALPQSFTPEVQAERQRFFQLFNQAASAAAAAPDNAIYSSQGSYQSQSIHRFAPQPSQSPVYTPTWTGPLASTVPAGLPGSVEQVGNTPEVAAAIAEFSRAYSAAVASTQPRTSSTPHQYGSAHQNTGHYIQNQQKAAQHSVSHYNPSHFNFAHNNANQYTPTQQKWTGALASDIPAGLPGSPAQVADTPEVQAAKAVFSRTFHNQLHSVLG